MVRVAFEPYLEFRKIIRGGDNAFSAVGQLLAYKKQIVKKINVPSDMVTNDIFTYFCCLSMGWKYKFVSSAIVFFQPPRKLKDLLKQNTRFHAGYNRMFKYFSKELVINEFKISRFTYLRVLLKQFIKHPILSGSYYLINVYSHYLAFKMGANLTAKWPVALTTKKLRVN
jgi:cellulose synthase/poly-beta-1,6-N-acetylglucosamine synthase-like glycosyltransferase